MAWQVANAGVFGLKIKPQEFINYAFNTYVHTYQIGLSKVQALKSISSGQNSTPFCIAVWSSCGPLLLFRKYIGEISSQFIHTLWK